MNGIPEKFRAWIEARKRHRLSHAHVQMARELGMNPKKMGKRDNHRQEPWKAPLPVFIEDCYEKRFGKRKPDVVRSIEQTFQAHAERKRARKLARQNGCAPGAVQALGADAALCDEGPSPMFAATPGENPRL